MKKAALPFTTISVVGLGLMGTSLIEACEDAGTVTAYGMGRNPVSIQKGIRDKVLADGAVLGQEDDHACFPLLRLTVTAFPRERS